MRTYEFLALLKRCVDDPDAEKRLRDEIAKNPGIVQGSWEPCYGYAANGHSFWAHGYGPWIWAFKRRARNAGGNSPPIGAQGELDTLRDGLPVGMRRDGDARPDPIVKQEIWRRLVWRYAIYAAIDDRQDVLDLWRVLGIPEVEACRLLPAQ